MQVDVEIALINASANELKVIQADLPPGFFIEDRSDRGWGLVIRTTQKLSDDFSEAIDVFLEPLSPLVEMVSSHAGILRVCVFYSTVTCTMRLNSCDRLAVFGLPLEISTYPSSDEE
ncbi:MAG TPA: hypothetical protein ENI94_10875 [Gammaproteobacteria bacterium]|nr:hypothetical protein [Gammaproteobacteria bacterium]